MKYEFKRLYGNISGRGKGPKALLSIQVFPFKVNQEQVEARIRTSHFLLPEDVLYFGGKPDVFAKILEINVLPDADDLQSQQVRLQLLSGRLSLEPVAAIRLENSDILRYIAQSQSPLGEALTLGEEHFQADFFNLGTLTLIEGIDFPAKYRVLNAIIEAISPFKKLVILDPLGVFEDQLPYPCLKGGEHIRFSLQHANSKRFLDSFGETVPYSVRGQVMENVAAHWPDVAQFTGFSKLLTSGMIIESPLKNLILQSCASVIHNKVFAEVPEQVFDWQTCQQNKVTVLDLSQLQEPWKQFFYTELAYDLFLPSRANLFPVLLYPERHLEAFDDFLRSAEEKGFSLLALASQRPSPSIAGLANNRIRALPPEQMLIEGELTRGLPVSLNIGQAVEPPIETALSHSIAKVPQSMDVHPETELFLPAAQSSLDYPDKAVTPSTSEFSVLQTATEAPMESVSPEPFKSEPEPSPFVQDEAHPPELIVDLSAPIKESKPTFLTPEQLHALLNGTHAVSEVSADFPNTVSDMGSPPEQSPLPVQEASSMSFGQPPVQFQSNSSPILPMASIEPSSSTSFDHVEPEAFTPNEVPVPPVPPSVVTPAPPTVPEEFHFDIDLDQKASHLPSDFESFASASPVLGQAIAVSLSQFELNPSQDTSHSVTDWQEVPLSANTSPHPVPEYAMPAPHHEGLLPVYTRESEVQAALDTLYPAPVASPQATSAPVLPGVEPPPERHPEPTPVVPKPLHQSFSINHTFKVGDKVQHPEYGLGIVQKVIPVEESMVLNITFEQVGKRLLDPALTPLTLLAAE